ncbi:SGNH/GDSL hydrolase family protein [Escherichia coli]|uniref:SGNH/GDSL hydrolase family protein n=1 Tax=Escherichia coli TaxID=562 RepID=UPI000BE6B63C|nr:SGNH/GDSL hydrolase family protein [Escherichia coli]
MTVSTEVDHNEYTGNGVTTSFPYTFRVFNKSDLVVQVIDLDENITVLALDTDYTVTGAGGYNGGNVILSKALANGYQISISRELPVTQETDLRNQGKFFAEVHEDAFDKLTMLIQQCFSKLRLALMRPSFVANYYDALNYYIRNVREPSQPSDATNKNYVDTLATNNLNKTLRVPEGYIPTLPVANVRKNKIVAMDNSGNPMMVLPESGSAADVMIELAKPTGAGLIGFNDITVSKQLEILLSESAPLFQGHIKTLDYWAAKMHAGETVIITSYADSTGDGNGSTGWTANPTVPVTGFPWSTAPVANSDHNAEAPNAWPIKLQTILRQYHRNNNISVYNAGYSGQQMQNGWANYYFEKAVLQNPYIPSNPDIVIISFGLNDITDAGSKVTEHIAQTIEVMKKVIAAGATPVLTTCDANWRSYNGWNSGSSGRDNEEAAAQINAAKKYMAEVLGVSIIDQDFMQKTWMSKNSDYSNQYELQPDGLHWGDTGHAMKAAFVAQSFMPDILRCYGTDIERICWMDSRMRYAKNYTSSWVPASGEEGYRYSRFPRIWYIQAADYAGSEVIFDFFVWSEGNQDSLLYRNFGNSNIGSAYAAEQLPRVRVFSLGSTTAYYDKELPDTGEDEAYINATDRPFYLTKLRYGLNRIQLIAPSTSGVGAFWGGWFEFNPFWKAKATFGYVNNYGAPNYVQVNALEKTGPLDFRFEADTANNRVAFMNPEMFDGTNCADIGQVGDKVEILVEGFFDTDTGFLFFGGKSLNRNSGSTDNNQEDNCLLLYATSKTFNLLQLRYPYQSSAPYPQIQTGIDDVYSATDRARKFLIRCEKTSPTTQTIKVYDGWETIDTPVLNYKGDWMQGKFCGGGIIGGVYATRNIARTVRVSQLLIRKFK